MTRNLVPCLRPAPHAALTDTKGGTTMVEQDKPTRPEKPDTRRDERTREESNIGCMPVVWGFLFGIIAGIVFVNWRF